MGSEPVEELPDDLEAWVTERAAADGTSREDVVRRLMAAHQLLDEHPDQLDDADAPDLGDGAAGPSAAEVDELENRIEELGGRVGELEADLDEKITDVRQRVIQVKREADAKAPADHDHPAIERRIDEGFENYEEILEYLTERTEALEDGADDRNAKLRRVANAVVDLRRRVSTIEGEIEKHAAAAELREAANRRGISEAACGSCGEAVNIGLLDEPTCPHCESPFDGVESGGWFRSNRLTVGDRPALESAPTPDPKRTPTRDQGAASGPSEAPDDGDGGTDGAPTSEPAADGFGGQPPDDSDDEAPDPDGGSTATDGSDRGTDPDADEEGGDR